MKRYCLTTLCSICVLFSYSQSSVQIRRVDSLINLINERKDLLSKTQMDTLYRGYIHGYKGPIVEKYQLFYVRQSGELLKVINFTAQNIYYYLSNQLIKVESRGRKRRMFFEYYFEGDSCFYFRNKDRNKNIPAFFIGHSKVYLASVKRLTPEN